MEIMYDAVDVTYTNKQPKFENSVGYYFYFVAFIRKRNFEAQLKSDYDYK